MSAINVGARRRIGSSNNAKGNRTSTTRANAPRQYNFYDTRGNRLGSGKTSPYDGSIELFDTHGNRTGEIKQDGNGGSRFRSNGSRSR